MGQNDVRLRDDPVIVLGMHHSGTSIFAEVLHRSGIFMQANMHHHESKFFTREVNDRLVMGGNGNWARLPIMPVAEVMQHERTVRDYIEKKAYKKYRAAGYDGVSRWGFKDPRTCVTLPLFMRLFPNAQLVHILRNAEDVARSLAARNKQDLGVVQDLAFWKELRRQYIERVFEFGRAHPGYYEFHYEDFCHHPVEEMEKVFAFLNQPLPDETIEFLRERIYTHRINITMQ